MAYDFKGMAFLVVDDFALIRDFLKGLVRSLGFQTVTVADNGQDALKYLDNRHYDVVLCDYYLGDGKDGQQVLEEAKYRGLLPQSSVFIMVTMEQLLPQAMAVIEHRPDGYLVKPVVQEVLVHRLNQALDRRRAMERVNQAIRNERKEDALDLCEELMEREPRFYTDLQEIKTSLLIEMEMLDTAERLLDELLAKRSIPWALFHKGKVLYLRGDHKGAGRYFLQLIRSNTHYLEAYDWLAEVQVHLGDPKKAMGIIQRALDISPKSVVRQRRVGELALRIGDLETAETALRSAVREGRHSCFASGAEYAMLTGLLLGDGRSAKALKILSDGLKVFPRNSVHRVWLQVTQAGVYDTRGEWTRTRDTIKALWREYPLVRRELPATVQLDLARMCGVVKMPFEAEKVLEDIHYYHGEDKEALARAHKLAEEISAGLAGSKR